MLKRQNVRSQYKEIGHFILEEHRLAAHYKSVRNYCKSIIPEEYINEFEWIISESEMWHEWKKQNLKEMAFNEKVLN